MRRFPYGEVPVAGQRIGIFGGSFNPPHAGHVAIAEAALRHLQLDWLWWLVSPQNPLKPQDKTADFAERLAQSKAIMRHPKVMISTLEYRLCTRITADFFTAIRPLLSQGNFVWVMGADSFAGLNKWHRWREIPASLPLAVFDRPEYGLKALSSPAARMLAGGRIDNRDAALLFDYGPGHWCYLPVPQRPESSTALRAVRDVAPSHER